MQDISLDSEEFKRYQVVPPLTEEEYADLKANIAKRGVQVPIEFDEVGAVLDGHHRLQICKELGITDYPKVVRVGLTEEEKFAHARSLNLDRRHLSREQRRELIKDAIRENPDKSNRQIAQSLGVDHKTVACLRGELESTGEIKASTVSLGTDGIERPRTEQREQMREQIREAIQSAPEKSDRQIARELGVSPDTVNRHRKDECPTGEIPQSDTTPTSEPDVGSVTTAQPDSTTEPLQPSPKPTTPTHPVSLFNPTERDIKAMQNPKVVSRMAETGETAEKAEKAIRREAKVEEVKRAQSLVASEKDDDKGSAILYVEDSIGITKPCDLLLTDPPYMTDVDDIDEFVDSWLFAALNGVKSDGFAYVFCGAYPEEIHAYTGAKVPSHIHLEQILVWSYKNTLGNNPRGRYKQNWQACLFYRGENAPDDLNCPLTSEQWATCEMNAPDGRLGDRFHAWQKPLELCERFIRHTTKKGDVVFDPFACTGTTLIAAANLGRNGIGYEIDERNAEIAFSRGVSRGR